MTPILTVPVAVGEGDAAAGGGGVAGGTWTVTCIDPPLHPSKESAVDCNPRPAFKYALTENIESNCSPAGNPVPRFITILHFLRPAVSDLS